MRKKQVAISQSLAGVQRLTSSEIDCFLYHGDCRRLLSSLPNNSIQLILTSPPYNVGKSYEQKQTFEEYIDLQREVISDCVRVLSDSGSICWQVGNHMLNGRGILPLDIALHSIFEEQGLQLRNRIVWHFEHGLHCKRRLSGRYEVIMWYTKGDDFVFNLDPIRVPQKYPGKKYFKGPNVGKLSCNPLGKNPSDVWIFPNVKHNHREKTIHPCQFPIELVDRLILSLTNEGDIVLDPFAGVSSALAGAILRKRRSIGAELLDKYVAISKQRIQQAFDGTLPVRPTGQEVYKPKNEKAATLPPFFQKIRQRANS